VHLGHKLPGPKEEEEEEEEEEEHIHTVYGDVAVTTLCNQHK
jgi:hypothetical protein